jgi:hypothetical protein
MNLSAILTALRVIPAACRNFFKLSARTPGTSALS